MADTLDPAGTGPASRDFTVQYQKLHLDIDLAHRAIFGRTEILILPESNELRTIRLNCRQTKIKSVSVEGKAVNLKDINYPDPYVLAKPFPSSSVHQHHLLRHRIQPYVDNPPAEELHIPLPRGVRVSDSAPTTLTLKLVKTEIDTLTPNEPLAGAEEASFTPLKIDIVFETKDIRDGLQFIGIQEDDTRYPHVYTSNSVLPGTACSLFPCVDDPTSRHPWDISIRCPRTLGDAFVQSVENSTKSIEPVDVENATSPVKTLGDLMGLNEREKALDLSVICSGNLTDEIIDPTDPSRKTVSFSTASLASANQIGFAVGPFEDVDLSIFRELDDDERLGNQAVRVHGYCLPGRAAEVRNTCMPLAKAVDFFTNTFTAFTGDSYKVCFVDDLPCDYSMTAGFSICSTRLLFPADVLDPLDTVPRTIVDALAAQYAGIALVAREPADAWLITGMRSFMTDTFMRTLTGNNEYRFRQKQCADRVHELDVNRPSLSAFGSILHLDPSEMEFMTLKAGVVLFILDRRLTKSSGSAGISRVISRFLTTSKGGDADATFISTSTFHQRCQKMGHLPLDSFFEQWVYCAGCPTFQVTQRSNKKRMVVEMLIRQVQSERQELAQPQNLDPERFLRDIKEEDAEVYAGLPPTVFVGPMTIRIHEADGTPYEHIVDIKETNTRFEVPYNTKYKRLGRSKRQKERLAATGTNNNEGQDEVLLYCLGDVLQAEDEVADWRLTDWSKEDEDRMNGESYEWIRMDADFEWICKLNINMPAYMFVSQLQQDRDVVAQVESLQYIAVQQGHPLISTILTRTVMDKRYFHGVRTMAATGLVKCATDECDWIGLYHLEKIFHELFCFTNSNMMRPNDFSERAAYFLQCVIPRAIGKIKDNAGEAPARVKRFFLDKLKFNDNSENEFSDNHYMSTLLTALAEALADGRGLESYDEDVDRDTFRKDAVNEIERYRRIDEWISSYQNIYSATALECLLKLTKGKVVQTNLQIILQYTRHGNGDNLRLKAFECLVELGMLRNNSILSYIIYTLSTGTSVYFRHHLYHILGRGLARIAMGEKKSDMNVQAMDGFVIEQEGSTEGRAADLARRQTVLGALAGLKEELGTNEVLKQALWTAIASTTINLVETNNLLELCSYLYEPVDKLTVTLKYPRYWRAQHLGKAVVAFRRTNKIRTRFAPKMLVPREPTPPPAPVVVKPKIRFGPIQPKVETPQPVPIAKPIISLKPSKPLKLVSTPKPVPPPQAATPQEPVPMPPPQKPKVNLSISNGSSSVYTNGITASPAEIALPTPIPKLLHHGLSVAPTVEGRVSRIVVLKISRDRLGRWPTGVKGPRPQKVLQQSNCSVINGHSSKASTLAASVKSGKAMSPPPRPATGNGVGPPTKKQKVTHDPSRSTSASPAPPNKKRKNSTSVPPPSAVPQPPTNRPVLKLKLGKSMGKIMGGGGGAHGASK